MEEPVVPFGQWLKHLRGSHDLTQAELAGRVGVALVSLRKIEAGERRPSKETALRLAEVLGVPAGEREAFVQFARAIYPHELAAVHPPALPQHSHPQLSPDAAAQLPTGPAAALLIRLGVFAGSFGLEAAEEVCAGEGAGHAGAICPDQVSDLLAGLVDQAWVVGLPGEAERRYRLPEAVRRFGQERLAAAGELAALAARHLDYYLALAEEGYLYAWLGRPAWVEWFDREYDNFAAALATALASEPAAAIRLGRDLAGCACRDGRVFDYCAWVDRILAPGVDWADAEVAALALYVAAVRAECDRDFPAARELFRAALPAAREAGDRDQLLLSLAGVLRAERWLRDAAGVHRDAAELLALADEERLSWKRAYFRGCALVTLAELAYDVDDDLARRHAEEALALARSADIPLHIYTSQTVLGLIALRWGELADGRARLQEAAGGLRRIGFRRGLDRALEGLGRVEIEAGDWRAAEAAYGQLAAVQLELRLPRGWLRLPLDGLCAAAALAGEDCRAARLLGALEAAPAFPPDFFTVMPQPWEPVHAPFVRTVRERLGEAAFAAQLAEGRQLTVEEALGRRAPV